MEKITSIYVRPEIFPKSDGEGGHWCPRYRPDGTRGYICYTCQNRASFGKYGCPRHCDDSAIGDLFARVYDTETGFSYERKISVTGLGTALITGSMIVPEQ